MTTRDILNPTVTWHLWDDRSALLVRLMVDGAERAFLTRHRGEIDRVMGLIHARQSFAMTENWEMLPLDHPLALWHPPANQ